VKLCDENAGGCGRSEQEGAVLRVGSSLCEACKEAIAEAEADDAAKLEEAEVLVAKARRDAARLAELEAADASDPTSVEHEEWQVLKRRQRRA
jgi:hypothetical protein